MSNKPNYGSNRKYSLRNAITGLTGDEANRFLSECDCPADIHVYDDEIIVEHYHVNGCPALRKRAS